jgi:DNA repair exonuclease SbcCD ATPase subunit
MEISEVVFAPDTEIADNKFNGARETITNGPISLQKLEEKAQKAQEDLEKEQKARKELEALNSKLLAEKTALLDSLSGEKGALQDYQEKTAKLTAQKNDLDNQLRVSYQKFHKNRTNSFSNFNER